LSERAGGADRLRERLRAERDERRRLAELVHDGPVQHLAAIGQMLDAATSAYDDGDPQDAHALVVRAREIAREASADLRELIAGYEPATLHEDGLAAAVRDLADRVGTRRGVSVTIDLPAAGLLGESARSGLYQLVREALDQAISRGPPSSISVSLTQTSTGGVTLVMTDDGAQERRQVVLDGLAERAEELNGTFQHERTDNATTIRITLPPSAAYV
jgi:two-component system, NarL family, sensor kinase